jgi:hypothetical protein
MVLLNTGKGLKWSQCMIFFFRKRRPIEFFEERFTQSMLRERRIRLKGVWSHFRRVE